MGFFESHVANSKVTCVKSLQNFRKMSGGLDAMKAQEADITKMLAATTHLGSENSETTMMQYIFKRRQDGVHIINLKKLGRKSCWLQELLLPLRTQKTCLSFLQDLMVK